MGANFLVEEPTDFVYLLDNVPHDWLFLQCKAVVSFISFLGIDYIDSLYNRSNIIQIRK